MNVRSWPLSAEVRLAIERPLLEEADAGWVSRQSRDVVESKRGSCFASNDSLRP